MYCTCVFCFLFRPRTTRTTCKPMLNFPVYLGDMETALVGIMKYYLFHISFNFKDEDLSLELMILLYIFLMEIGVWRPWENKYRFDNRMPLPYHGLSGKEDKLAGRVSEAWGSRISQARSQGQDGFIP